MGKREISKRSKNMALGHCLSPLLFLGYQRNL